MSWNKNNKNDWGGDWTERKLEAFTKYVKAYLVIMNSNKYWETIYFDGFAGSGSIDKKENQDLVTQLQIIEEEERVYKGSAERILDIIDFKFDYYYFIDQNQNNINSLKEKLEINHSNKKLYFRNNDTNQELIKLANAMQNSKKYAALIFLDPFGMQINWDSIELLKNTKSDIWILLPTGVIINRLLNKSGELVYIDKLEKFFGLNKDEIIKKFYITQTNITLFGEITKTNKVNEPIKKIANLYIERLQNIWKYVTKEPLVLKNSKGIPIFHLIFASNNNNALKIANQIIDKNN